MTIPFDWNFVQNMPFKQELRITTKICIIANPMSSDIEINVFETARQWEILQL